jgi:ribosomal protein L32
VIDAKMKIADAAISLCPACDEKKLLNNIQSRIGTHKMRLIVR